MSAEGEALAFAAIYPDRSASGDWGRGRSIQAGLSAIRAVMGRIDPGANLHFIGGNGAATYQFLSEIKVRQVLLWHAKEPQSALAAAGLKHGLVALAGTGAFGHLNCPSALKHADSMGPLLGDFGGAYQIGREGLRAAMRSRMCPLRTTSLHEAVVRTMGFSPTDPELYGRLIHEGVRIYPDRTAVAAYASVVDEQARLGDAVALRILLGAADDLAETLEALVRSAGVENEALTLVGVGGVIQHSDLYWDHLCTKVAGFLPRRRPLRINFPQAAGLALAGLNLAIAQGAIQAEPGLVRARLLATLPPLIEKEKTARSEA
jgi:hypothetical protein